MSVPLHDDGAGARYDNGLGFHMAFDFSQAVAEYNAALSIRPNLLEAVFNRGDSFLGQKDFVNAIADFSAALEFDSNSNLAGTYFNRGYSHHARREFGLAVSDYDRCLWIDNEFPGAAHNRALASAGLP